MLNLIHLVVDCIHFIMSSARGEPVAENLTRDEIDLLCSQPDSQTPLTGHVQSQLSLDVLAHLHPAVLPRRHLLEVDDVVAGRSISVAVELEAITAQSCDPKKHDYRAHPELCTYSIVIS